LFTKTNDYSGYLQATLSKLLTYLTHSSQFSRVYTQQDQKNKPSWEKSDCKSVFILQTNNT